LYGNHSTCAGAHGNGKRKKKENPTLALFLPIFDRQNFPVEKRKKRRKRLKRPFIWQKKSRKQTKQET
jgi:hypothetical protein